MILFTKDFWLLSMATPAAIMGVLMAVDIFGKHSGGQEGGILDFVKQRLRLTAIIAGVLAATCTLCTIIFPLKRAIIARFSFMDFPMRVYTVWALVVICAGVVRVFITFRSNFKKALAERDAKSVEPEKAQPIPVEMKSGCPPLSLLRDYKLESNTQDVENLRQRLEQCLESFGLIAGVAFKEVKTGPSVYRFTYKLSAGTRISEYVKYSKEIAIALGFESINIIGGKDGLLFELPNFSAPTVYAKHVFAQQVLDGGSALDLPLNVAVGRNAVGDILNLNISEAPHLLVAGATGGGKSIFMNVLITGIVLKNSPAEVQMIMIDPKMVEFSVYNSLPHLIFPVVTEPVEAAEKLEWAVAEMERRFELMRQSSTREVSAYNAGTGSKLPLILIFIDELADLMMVAKKNKGIDVENSICRLGQKARACGIHLIVATQRPSVDVITGLIKSNLPSRVAFVTASSIDSKVILDESGAEKLLGKGDGYFKTPKLSGLQRFKCAFIDGDHTRDIENIVCWWKDNWIAEPALRSTSGVKRRKFGEREKVNGPSNEDIMPDDIFDFGDEAAAGVGEIESEVFEDEAEMAWEKHFVSTPGVLPDNDRKLKDYIADFVIQGIYL